MKRGDWIVSGHSHGVLSNPGRVVVILDHAVVFEVPQFYEAPEMYHRSITDVRIANKSDFDRAILEANAEQLKIEKFISQCYEHQKEVE
jgi:hypothetical protein